MPEDKEKQLLEKIAELEEKIAVLENRSEQLSRELSHVKDSMTAQRPPMPQAQSRQARPLPQRQGPQPVRPVPPRKVKQPRERKSLEGFIGKNAMGLGATVLVFIAMVMFATLLMPYIGEELKCAAMYIFSFILIGLGEYVYRKQKNGYLMLSACGMGAVFISIFATRIYFHFIDSVPLYLLLLVWVGAMAFLSKKRHLLFLILGQVGIFAAIIIASIGLITPADLYLSAGFMAACEALFFGLFWKAEYKYQLINAIGLFVTLAAFNSGAYLKLLSRRYIESPAGLVIILLSIIVMCLAACRLILISKNDDQHPAAGIISVVNAGSVAQACEFLKKSLMMRGFLIPESVGYLLGESLWINLLLSVYLAVVFIVMMKTRGREGEKKPVIEYICFILMLSSLLLLSPEAVPYMLALVLLVLVAYNYKANRTDFYYLSQAAIYFGLAAAAYNDSIIATLIMLALSIAQMAYSRRKNPDSRMLRYEGLSYISTILMMIILVNLVSHQIWTGSSFMRYFATVGLFIVIQMAARETDWVDNDAQKINIFHLANLGMMVYSLGGFMIDLSTAELVFYSLLTLGLFSINLMQLIEIRENLGAYIAGKYTVLSGMVLYCFGAWTGYSYSIVFLILAIASVITGFKLNNKSIRLYGLVLSMLSVFKLIMFDISYSNTLGRAVSFLISGLICFGISMVYNHIEKQQKQKTGSEIQ